MQQMNITARLPGQLSAAPRPSVRSRRLCPDVFCKATAGASSFAPALRTIDFDSLESRRAQAREHMEWFRVPPKVYFKGGCLEVALAELAGKRRAFIVTDKNVYDMEYADKITLILDRYNVQHQTFYHVAAEPTQGTLKAALAEVQDFRPDAIIAVGGGAPMDAAKAIWLMYEMPDVTLDQLIQDSITSRSRAQMSPVLGNRALCICVPTTSGTGAEVTPFAVVKDEKTGHKFTLADYALTPSMAIVDPQLVVNLPREQTAYGGMLTLAHAMESYMSVFASDYSRGLSKHAMTMMSRYYQRAYNMGTMDYHAREKMHNAATVAGMAFANTYLGVCHALAAELSATFGWHLGLASGMLLVPCMEFMARDPTTRASLAELADHLHLGGGSVDEKYSNVLAWINKMKAAADIPSTMSAVGGNVGHATLQDHMESICENTLADVHVMASPVLPSAEDLKSIIVTAWHGKKK